MPKMWKTISIVETNPTNSSYKVIFQSRELSHIVWRYLESKWFEVSAETLCSTIPQYELHITDNNWIREELTGAEEEIINLFLPWFLSDF